MYNNTLTSFKELLLYIEDIEMIGYDINLFRGQSTDDKLLPSICREDPKFNTTEIEIKMLEDFKRRSPLLINQQFRSDWEWLIYAQHFGLKTRLLDWSNNPLIALWFACQNPYSMDKSSYLFILSCDDNMRVDLTSTQSPFMNSSTKILRPEINNSRILAQSGWFTAHIFSNKAKKFVALETNKRLKTKLIKLEIPALLKKEFLRKLSMFGINSRTVFPDVNGLSQHLNWKYLADKY